MVVGGGGALDASYPISLPFLSSNPVSIFFLNLIYMYIYNLEYPYDTSLYFSQIPVLFFLHFTYSINFLSLYPTSHHLCPPPFPTIEKRSRRKSKWKRSKSAETSFDAKCIHFLPSGAMFWYSPPKHCHPPKRCHTKCALKKNLVMYKPINSSY